MEHHHLENQHMDVPEFDPNFEPQCRARSYTWPSRPREAVKEDDNRSTPTSSEGDPVVETAVNKENLGLKAKTSSRRNAWGNLSYADLITKAIDSSPEKRLTLSQIYDWMVQNVSYFKDKGDTNSSAGWKNSIRHNLSLHSRFMRIQNEGTGKSSWWVLNPDAKPGKTPRRRATSMDTKAFEKKRGRVKKKLEQLRALGGGPDQSPTAGSDYCDSELGSLDPFSLSPQDFRARTSSNASSIGGRLSPIQSLYEPDLHDSQVPPMSPIPWNQTSTYNNVEGPGFTETLSESLAEMFVGESMTTNETDHLGARSTLSTPSPLQRQPSPSNYLPAPPPYNDQLRPSPRQMSPNSSAMLDNTMLDTSGLPGIDSYNTNPTSLSNMNVMNMGGALGSTDICLQDSYVSQTLSELLQDSPPASMQHSPQANRSPYNNSVDKSSYQNLNGDNMLGGACPQQQTQQGNMSAMLRSALTEKQQLARTQLQTMLQNQQQRQILQARLKQLRQQQILRQQQQIHQEQLKQQQQQLIQQQLSQQSPQLSVQHGLSTSSQGTLQPHHMAGGMVQQVSSTSGASYGLDCAMTPPAHEMPIDLDLVTISEGTSEDLQCDVDQIINHELSMDGLLDFNFDSGGSGGAVQT